MKHKLVRTAAVLTAAVAAGLAAASAAAPPAFAGSPPPVAGGLLAPPAGPAAIADSLRLYQQGFTGAPVPSANWYTGGAGDQPCLTGGTPGAASAIPACAGAGDPAGQGVLRLTSNATSQSGYVLYRQALAADRGLDVQFDMYQYNTSTKKQGGGADGISFILVDGGASPSAAGEQGGALGYKNLAGGYLAVGFDQWGNFSTSRIFGTGNGADQRIPNTIVVRGAQAVSYPSLASIKASHPLAADGATGRRPGMRHVEIQLSPQGFMNVYVTYGKQRVWEIRNLDMSGAGQPALPATVKFAFAASTGWNTAIHEISGLQITALPPDLVMTLQPTGDFQSGGTGTLTATVADKPTAGPTTGPVTATITIPAGMTPTSAAGTGWTCSVSGQTVSCTRPDLLQPGDSFPPITIANDVASNAPPQLTVPGSATTPNDTAPADGNATVTVPIAKGPDLTTTIEPVGQFAAPGTGTYLLTVANDPRAGRVQHQVTETLTVPAAQTAISATGNGWTCSMSGQTVTCTTQAPLAAGQSYPPIAVTTQNTPCTVNPVAQVSTKGDTGQQRETATANVTFVPAAAS
jgi:Bacterial lectin